MPFGIPAEDFHGGFGLPEPNEYSDKPERIVEPAYKPHNLRLSVTTERIGECPKCGKEVSDLTASYCPKCGCKLDWEP